MVGVSVQEPSSDSYRGISILTSSWGRLINASRNRLKVGDRVPVRILRPSMGGDVIGQLDDGRLVFVRGAAPSDHVLVELTQIKKRFARGQVVSVQAGPDRVAPFCPHYAQCGGCPWQAIPVDTQREALRGEISRRLDQLSRIGAVEATAEPLATFATDRYRATARLKLEGGVLGYVRPKSNQLMAVDVCYVLNGAVQRLIEAIRATLLESGFSGNIRLTAFDGNASGTVFLEGVDQDRGRAQVLAEALLGLEPVHGVGISSESWTLTLGECRNRCPETGVVHEAGSFVQAHQQGNLSLVEFVTDAVGRHQRVLELFAGSGNFTRALVQAGTEVVAVESDRDAALRLKRMSDEVGPDTTFEVYAQAAEDFHGGSFATILLDPPRAGFRELARLLRQTDASRVVYVSCHLATLVRDVEPVLELGWRLSRLKGFDLFPHTGHLEVVAVLERSE
ncbi:MAG: class I SAM-dependent RNA methyltransferase [Bradymonadia bacterium]